MLSLTQPGILPDRRTARWSARLKSTACNPGPRLQSRRCRDAARNCGCTTAPIVRCARCQPGPTATMYVCGITPYDATHLGHAATYLAFDLIHRIWLRPRPRRALRAERHRRRRPAVRAGQPRRHGLARPRRPARSTCSATTWPRCGCCRRANTSRPPRPSPRSSSSSRRCWPPGPPTSSMTPNTPTCTSAPTPRRSSATSPATTATPCSAVRRTRRRPGPRGQDRRAGRAAVARRAARRAQLAVAVRTRPARLARRVRGDRAQPHRHRPRHPGRRQRPDLPASRVLRRARRIRYAGTAIRPTLRARRA